MITYVYGDIFQSPAKVLVNAVNTVGVMGKGIAYDFKRFYPEMFTQYRERCETDSFDIGQLMLYTTPHKWVLNFPTKKHFRAQSSLEHITAGLKKFVSCYADLGITSTSFPRLGTGSGGLDWEDVRPVMESYLDPLPISIYIHHYGDYVDDPFAAKRRNIRALRVWLDNRPRYLNFDRFWRTLTGLIGTGRIFVLPSDKTQKVKAHIDTRKSKRRNLLLDIDSEPEPIFIAESSLVDLWAYIQRAGYVEPRNLPAGLETIAPYLIAVLAELDMVRPVYLATAGRELEVGLHYIPPPDKRYDPVIVATWATE